MSGAWPASFVQWSPPSVDFQTPWPAPESPDALASPVPAYRVWRGASKNSEPMLLVGSDSDTGCQLGSPARALVVRHTPPPAAPIHIVHRWLVQLGSSARDVVRPAVTYSLLWRLRKAG